MNNYTQAYNIINSKFDISKFINLTKLLKLQELALAPKKGKINKREYTEKLKVELIKFYYNSTDQELEEINAIIEYPLLWGRIENELPHIPLLQLVIGRLVFYNY